VDFGELLRLLEQGGMVGLLLIIIVGGARRWWVFGWTYKETAIDRDEWKRAALRGTTTATKGAEAADKSAEVLKEAIKILQDRQ
jgi:hypothetical protein